MALCAICVLSDNSFCVSEFDAIASANLVWNILKVKFSSCIFCFFMRYSFQKQKLCNRNVADSTMMTTEKQGKSRIDALYDLGYTVAAAARKLGCTRAHLWHVLMGNRTSEKLLHDALTLPKRPLRLRERVSAR